MPEKMDRLAKLYRKIKNDSATKSERDEFELYLLTSSWDRDFIIGKLNKILEKEDKS